MSKTCLECKNENTSNYKNLCISCYTRIKKLEMTPRYCVTCHKEYKNYGINCYSCSKALRESKEEKKACSQCGRNNVKIRHKSLCLCVTCFRLIQEAEIDGLREKRILYNRQSHRKYRGHEPYGPLRRKTAGEGYINKQGYKIVTKVGHPNANKDKGAIPEHIFVMSEYLKRPLRKGENIHHKNGIRDDNRLENLELWDKTQPPGQRVDDKIEWCKEFLALHGYKTLLE